jgi:hypothetical protein
MLGYPFLWPFLGEWDVVRILDLRGCDVVPMGFEDVLFELFQGNTTNNRLRTTLNCANERTFMFVLVL